MYRLIRATGCPDWVEGLCPADLFHYLGLEVASRNMELRELLHVHVSAVAAINDGGTTFKKLDARLDPNGVEAKKPAQTAEAKAARAKMSEEQMSRFEAALTVRRG